jgi:hypothetical protein
MPYRALRLGPIGTNRSALQGTSVGAYRHQSVRPYGRAEVPHRAHAYKEGLKGGI